MFHLLLNRRENGYIRGPTRLVTGVRRWSSGLRNFVLVPSLTLFSSGHLDIDWYTSQMSKRWRFHNVISDLDYFIKIFLFNSLLHLPTCFLSFPPGRCRTNISTYHIHDVFPWEYHLEGSLISDSVPKVQEVSRTILFRFDLSLMKQRFLDRNFPP